MTMTESLLEERHIYYRTNEFRQNVPTLVFVHGLSGSSSAWTAYEKLFAKDYNIVTFDLRGHGKSGKHASYDDYALSHFVNDLRALLDHLNIQKCTLISHSFATLIALEFVLFDQDRIDGVVFLSPNFSIRQRALSASIAPFVLLITLLDKVVPGTLKPGKHVDYTKYPNTGDWNIPRMIADVGNTTLLVYLYCTKHSCRFERMGRLSEIKVPVLIMHGRKDTIFPVKNSIVIADRIPGAQLIIIERTDHILVLNNFKEVSAAIGEFLAKRVYTVYNS